VLAFGDSLTYGTGAPRDAAYPAVLARLTGLAVINAGVPGEVSASGLERMPAALEAHRPELVLLVHGGNDTLRRLPPEDTRANLRAMVEAGRSAGAQVAMLGVPGRNLTLSAPDFYAAVAEELAVPIDNRTLPRLLRDRSLKADPVHLNAAGYRRLAEAVRELLVEAGALP
jgi:lysophospholipase L1-like esterase